MSLKDKVVLITGAGGGLGMATAVRFANEGSKLVLVDLNEQAVSKTLEAVREITSDVHFVSADVTNVEDVQKYVNEAVNKFGRIDSFFNNAGIDAVVKPITEIDEDVFDKVMNVNTKGVFLGLKYVLKVMQKQGSGSIINTASVHALKGFADRGPYVASKHAVAGLTTTAAAENAPFNIRVNAVCPTTVLTDITKAVAKRLNPDNPQEHFDIMLKKIPANRLGKPEDIANLVQFLSRDESGFITGALIPVDGGMTAAYY